MFAKLTRTHCSQECSQWGFYMLRSALHMSHRLVCSLIGVYLCKYPTSTANVKEGEALERFCLLRAQATAGLKQLTRIFWRRICKPVRAITAHLN